MLIERRLPEIPGGAFKIFETAEIAPVRFIGTECEDALPTGSETQVRSNNRERTVLGEFREESRRNRSQCTSSVAEFWRYLIAVLEKL